MPYLIKKLEEAESQNTTCGVMRGLIKESDSKNFDFAHFVITGETKEHYHNNLTEVYYILKGCLAVEIEGNVEKLTEGSLMMIYPRTKHKAWKVGEEDVEMIVVCSPPWTKEDEVLVVAD